MRTLFIVDDDRLWREMLSRLLEKHRYVVRSFGSPAAALDAIHSGYPDVLISDVNMPGVNGLELAERARERDPHLPVLLVTADSTPDVEQEAAALGVLHVFEKPIKDLPRFRSVLRGAIAKREEVRTLAGFDQLRLGFLTGLAHELRTPVTAIKLALDSLFGAHETGRSAAHDRLVSIGQRNLDRIIRLVEGQLDLLQITLGDVSVSRRLVVLNDVLRKAVAATSPCVRRMLVADDPVCRQPVFLFSDPDRLCAVLQYILENSSMGDGRPTLRVLPVAADVSGDVVIEFDNMELPRRSVGVLTRNVTTSRRTGDGGGTGGAGEGTFESRAFGRLVESLAGEIRVANEPSGNRVRLVVPLCPPFDGELDFVAPINGLREAAALSGRGVTMLKCDVKNGGGPGERFSDSDIDFFERCSSALSDGDALVRSRAAGTYYLVLIERSADEIQHVVEFLNGRADGDGRSSGVADVDVLRSFQPVSEVGDELLGCASEIVAAESQHTSPQVGQDD